MSTVTRTAAVKGIEKQAQLTLSECTGAWLGTGVHRGSCWPPGLSVRWASPGCFAKGMPSNLVSHLSKGLLTELLFCS